MRTSALVARVLIAGAGWQGPRLRSLPLSVAWGGTVSTAAASIDALGAEGDMLLDLLAAVEAAAR